jgi:hypothetical protein
MKASGDGNDRGDESRRLADDLKRVWLNDIDNRDENMAVLNIASSDESSDFRARATHKSNNVRQVSMPISPVFTGSDCDRPPEVFLDLHNAGSIGDCLLGITSRSGEFILDSSRSFQAAGFTH